jgi:predicted GNAT superfamily acetyltransferase
MDVGVSEETDVAAAEVAFDPERFGCRPFGRGWLKEDPKLGEIVVCALGWEHAMMPSYDIHAGNRLPMDALEFVVHLQRHVWGFPPELLVPTNVMAIVRDGGGAVLAAYQRDKGFNADGWLGFAIALGGSHDTYVSHMLGVREDLRGAHDIGWLIKVIQGYEALKSGHLDMIWTFDPMRGANAKLNLEKLGATVDEFTIDKYGVLKSTLYGDVPSDRFTAHWDLLSRRVHERIAAVRDGSYTGLTLADLHDVPDAAVGGPGNTSASSRLRYAIPGDIDELMRVDPERAVAWRQEIRHAMAGRVTTKSAVIGDIDHDGPAAMSYHIVPGHYLVTGFATGTSARGQRESAYLLTRRDDGKAS